MSLPPIDETHSPDLRTWVEEAEDHPDFPVQNLPFGTFSRRDEAPRPGVAIGEHLLDRSCIRELLPSEVTHLLADRQLNGLFALPTELRGALRRTLSRLLGDMGFRDAVESARVPANDYRLHLPAALADGFRAIGFGECRAQILPAADNRRKDA